ncbi:hypothetical protein A3C09_01385 [Candidatus Uhrbacteria bacterium RIFCSPHIGHO2_02_FULL_47_44]|uniref:DUF4015 domain-containing protein n=1 Tax=Candidatus Uhrbacteria bacterium RIFCSPLOWO2_02_FULL_48_18 TaxID=1802408 RepID=A0A1F7V8W3_9BACT|nr:MAG: hypothetical protein A3C09_01385 [Candidatus Uhrbacteria bacterium RIFCSPHIGHO2_02_FULL_47_44]OGL77437.1 MAG: hypothetical protein A3E97_00435 [Candidatus Uhrbacteria bacterium RIFCSPHIGHO2_12_FULL_47_12]OGL81799.1 MAG: hypothetical protein A3B20_01750 [Candidatus Uhrbacteria bacterium RIFCSPLOWO2_01_FULL_47_17]OGL86962.1 MAG: hypothetical protein A3I41_03340 [Candidatus Uhrbacteria bacterium RIFCSPLOWO2_02_FULL_48_18]OGL94361.1 MAG: hypothetical protein A3H12_05190 [Candidatus Uhrbacte
METTFFTSKKFIVVTIICVVLVSVFIASIQIVRSIRARSTVVAVAPTAEVVPKTIVPESPPLAPEPPPIIHIPLPEEARGIYWTAVTAATSRGDVLIDYMQKTGLNTVVIDLKMDNGQLAFVPNDASLSPYAMKKPAIQDLDALLKKLADDNMYRIARIAVMRDSAFASVVTSSALRSSGGGLWRDKTGSAWIDPTSPEAVTYALALAREAYARGFDEVQFDYVRFASDGRISAIVYPLYKTSELKVDAMKRFFAAVGDPLRQEKIPVSFDLFGLVCMGNDGLGIGQRLSDVMPSTDFVSPMVYPSHYANGFQGFPNPATRPYEVIKISLDHALELLLPPKIETMSIKNTDGSETILKKTIPRTAEEHAATAKQFRPWIQDFDIGAVYTGAMIEAQIKAVRDAGGSGYLIWNARNVYEPAKYVETK